MSYYAVQFENYGRCTVRAPNAEAARFTAEAEFGERIEVLGEIAMPLKARFYLNPVGVMTAGASFDEPD
jgi:hypothetical protein